MPNFPLSKQVKIVIASMALHKFIRIHFTKDQEFMPYDDDDELLSEEEENEREIVGEEQGTNSLHEREMDEERDRIVVLLIHRESSLLLCFVQVCPVGSLLRFLHGFFVAFLLGALFASSLVGFGCLLLL
ncbi:hypothetical protein Ddye_011677 [Dipteronia dyeriana]|uniref:Uncharacterized protein n=1 Tax=Dipteronia dyeriana TaxID=168575 RepID=A0AAE0CHE2_9ROSI|nr:hypothetical protein Ddye_011677 [Dipteronia dyeriana]